MSIKEQSFGNISFKWNPDFKWKEFPDATRHLFTPYQLGRKVASFNSDIASKTLPYLGAAALGGGLGYLASGKNKARNSILGILAGLGSVAGYDFLTHKEPTPIVPPNVDTGPIPNVAPEPTPDKAQTLNPQNNEPNISSAPKATYGHNTWDELKAQETLKNFAKNPSDINNYLALHNLTAKAVNSDSGLAQLAEMVNKEGILPKLPRDNSSPIASLLPAFNFLNQKDILNSQKERNDPSFYANKAQFDSAPEGSPFVENAINMGTFGLPGFVVPSVLAGMGATGRNQNLGSNIDPKAAIAFPLIATLASNLGRNSAINFVKNIPNFGPITALKSMNRLGPAMVLWNAMNDLTNPVNSAIAARDPSVIGQVLAKQNYGFRGPIYDKLNVSDNNFNPFAYSELKPAELGELAWDQANKLLAHPVSHPIQTGDVIAKGVNDISESFGQNLTPFAVNGLKYLQQQPANIQAILKSMSPQDLLKLDRATTGGYRPFEAQRTMKDLAPKIDLMKNEFAKQNIPNEEMQRILGVYLGGIDTNDPFKGQKSLQW